MPTIYYSRRSRRAPAFVCESIINRRTPKASWLRLATRKGYRFYGRSPTNRTQVYLRCTSCSEIMSVHSHVLRTAYPECTSCYLKALANEAADAGLELVKPCPDDSHRAIYRAPCGHEISRQRGRIQKIAAGGAAFRCEICLEERYKQVANAQGWALAGAASSGRPGYRSYRHDCGHKQDVSVGNMLTGRFSCNGCSSNWTADPSFIYLDFFELPHGGGQFVKIGMSRRPLSRLLHQFDLAEGVHAEVLAKVPMETGVAALREEKRMHKFLRTHHPAWVVGSVELDWIRVSSEIYRIEALPTIRELFAELTARMAT